MSKTYDLDQGKNFGTWGDRVSKLMYQDSNSLFDKIDFEGKKVADFGGANGLLGKALNIDDYTVVDIDKNKADSKHFINDSILTHKGDYDIIIIRYVLHYLSDEEVTRLIENIKSFHKGELIILQFTNDGEDMDKKVGVSAMFEQPTDGKKYFRTNNELLDLLSPIRDNLIENKDLHFEITEEFYNNRFGLDIDEVIHGEDLRFLRYKLSNSVL